MESKVIWCLFMYNFALNELRLLCTAELNCKNTNSAHMCISKFTSYLNLPLVLSTASIHIHYKLFLISYNSPSLPLHNNSKITALQIVTFQKQIWGLFVFEVKCYIYCGIYVFCSHLTYIYIYITDTIFIRLLFFKCALMKILSFVFLIPLYP